MDCFICGQQQLHIGTIVTYSWMTRVTCLDHCYLSGLCVLHMWQSSWPASFSPVGLTLWPNWLERWFVTLSRLSTQVRIPVGLSVLGRYIGGLSTGLDKAQRIDSSLRADWLSCFSLAWWEWRVARQGCLLPLRKGGMWQSTSFSPVGLTLWPNWLECWLMILSRLSTQVRIPVGLSVPGRCTYLDDCDISGSWLSHMTVRNLDDKCYICEW